MRRTLDELIVDVHELIGLPVQVHAGMGTLVPVGMQLSVVIDNKQLHRARGGVQSKLPRFAWGNNLGVL